MNRIFSIYKHDRYSHHKQLSLILIYQLVYCDNDAVVHLTEGGCSDALVQLNGRVVLSVVQTERGESSDEGAHKGAM